MSSRIDPRTGISTYGANPAGVDGHLKPLLEHALSVIPQSSVAETPIYLLATAGMRLLPEDQRRAVLDRACRYIRSNYAFAPGDCSETVRVISGEEEGLFGWIAVNYLMDGFDRHEHSDESGHAGSSTFGFLDMGGASTQIAFEPSAEERIKHADNLVDVHLRQLDGRDVVHPIFVTTWLGYGTNQARQRFVDGQITARDQVAKNDLPALSDNEAPLKVIDDPCLPRSLLLDEKRHPGYAFRGTGDFATCVRRTSPLLNKDAPCLDEPCLFNGVHAPHIDFSVNHFIGISEYWYSTQELWSLGGVYDFVEFERHAAAYCSREWEEIRREHPGDAQKDRLELQCFKAAWIVNILHEGIGVPRLAVDAGGAGDRSAAKVNETAQRKAGEKGLASKPSFQSLDSVGGVAISWTLGKMVLEVSQSVSGGVEALPHAGKGAIDWPSSWRPRLSSTLDPLLVILVCFLAFLAWFLSSPRRRKSLFHSLPLRRSWNVQDYALVGMEEGQPPSPSKASPSPRLGVPSLNGNGTSPRPRMTRHAFSSPNVVGKRLPSTRGLHGRAISTDVHMSSESDLVSSSVEDEGRTLSRVASTASLHGGGLWMGNVRKEGSGSSMRGRSATPTSLSREEI